MYVKDLDIPEKAKDIITSEGISELYPPQREGVDDILNGNNCVFALPTASGKSLLSYLAIIKQVVEKGGKGLYIVPLKALASEKRDDLKKFEQMGISVTLSMGDYDKVDPNLSKHDVIVATSEKADSLLRHNVDWLSKLNVIVADEVHLVDSMSRGATLEVTLSKLKQRNPNAQIVALSATINNSEDVAEWLNAKHYKSTWRPVTLRKGVNYKSTVAYESGDTESIKYNDEPVESLAIPTVRDGNQCIVFVNSRRSTKSVAENIAPRVRKLLKDEEKKKLEKIAQRINKQAKTDLGISLSLCVKDGTAFHHAGLNSKQREMVEKAFKDRLIKIISATPTLAAGINMPARRVIVRDAKRYDSDKGYMDLIPVMEIQQMLGRAGRPGYDTEGEAIVVAKKEDDLREYMTHYILGKPEKITSKLIAEPSLRTHLLALIATDHCNTYEEIMSFLKETFYYLTGDSEFIKYKTKETIQMLIDEELIEDKNGFYISTEFGRKVSNLYIDPLTAIRLKHAVQDNDPTDDIAYLHSVCFNPNMYNLWLRGNEKVEYEEEMNHLQDSLLVKGYEEDMIQAYKTANLLNEWISEIDEEEITNKYNVGPGDIYSKISTAEWIAHAFTEISWMFNPEHLDNIRNLSSRLMHGIQRELLPLVKIKGIGRIRARNLYDAGYKTPSDVRSASVNELVDIDSIGPVLAKQLSDVGFVEQEETKTVSTEPIVQPTDTEKTQKNGQYKLVDF